MSKTGKAVDFEAITDKLSLLGNSTRLQILSLADGETTVGSFAEEVGVSLSAISQHLGKLKAAGLVTLRRDAQEFFYTANHDALRKLLAETAEALGL